MKDEFEACFPAARWFRLAGVPPGGDAVAEPAELGDPADPPSERLLQCVWYDPAFRPERLETADGEPVVVESPGVWNLEAGPDFLGAALVVGHDRRRIEGDVELHLRPADWNRHGHAADPRYARVRVHVTHHPGPLPAGNLPPGAVQIALRDALAAMPGFSFDAVDPAAYPYAARVRPTPCAAALEAWTPDERERFLAAAGEDRLRRKAVRLSGEIVRRGPAQVLFEELMAALGYRHNKAPFRLLAERVPLAALRECAAGDSLRAYALLMGAGGLLPAEAGAEWDDESRAFLRRLWDDWWKLRARWDGRGAPRAAWRLSGLRPLNHPARRLMAAARLFAGPVDLAAGIERLRYGLPGGFRRTAREILAAGDDGYWTHRLAWGGARLPKPSALIGPDRIRAVIANVLVPYMAATGGGSIFRDGPGALLPDESPSGLVLHMAHTLFGPDHPRSLRRGGLPQQGLLAVFHDRCLHDRSHCRECPLPDWLRRVKQGFVAAGDSATNASPRDAPAAAIGRYLRISRAAAE